MQFFWLQRVVPGGSSTDQWEPGPFANLTTLRALMMPFRCDSSPSCVAFRLFLSLSFYMCIHMHTYAYICIHMHTYAYIHTYIHTYMHAHLLFIRRSRTIPNLKARQAVSVYVRAFFPVVQRFSAEFPQSRALYYTG